MVLVSILQAFLKLLS